MATPINVMPHCLNLERSFLQLKLLRTKKVLSLTLTSHTWIHLLSSLKDYSKIWEVIKIMLVISHGQASVERGFSTNKPWKDKICLNHPSLEKE